MKMYRFVQQYSAHFPVETLCQVIGVSRSAYYSFVAGQTYQSAAKEEQQETAVITVLEFISVGMEAAVLSKSYRRRDKKLGQTKCVPFFLPMG